jgi:hypothetical protein
MQITLNDNIGEDVSRAARFFLPLDQRAKQRMSDAMECE